MEDVICVIYTIDPIFLALRMKDEKEEDEIVKGKVIYIYIYIDKRTTIY